MRLGELLIEAGAIDDRQLEVALRSQRQFGGRLGTNLIELGFLTEAMLTKVLAAQLHLPRASEGALENISRSVLDLVPSEQAAKHCLCPVRLDGRRLHVAMSDPLDNAAIAMLCPQTGYEVRALVAGDGLIRHALQKHYGISAREKLIRVVASGVAARGVAASAGATGPRPESSARPPTPITATD